MIKRLIAGSALLVSNAVQAHEAAMLDDVSHALAHSGGAGALVLTGAAGAAAAVVILSKLRRVKSRSRRD